MLFSERSYKHRDRPIYTMVGEDGAVEWMTDAVIWHVPMEAFGDYAHGYPCDLLPTVCHEQRDVVPARRREVYDSGDLEAIKALMVGDYRAIQHTLWRAREQRSNA